MYCLIYINMKWLTVTTYPFLNANGYFYVVFFHLSISREDFYALGVTRWMTYKKQELFIFQEQLFSLLVVRVTHLSRVFLVAFLFCFIDLCSVSLGQCGLYLRINPSVICATNYNGYVPLFVSIPRSVPHSWLGL